MASLFGFHKYKTSPAAGRGADAYEQNAAPPKPNPSFGFGTGMREVELDYEAYDERAKRTYPTSCETAPRRSVRYLPIKQISVPADRQGDTGDDALADSIREVGLIQPITVRLTPSGSYELIAGARRLRACQILGRTKIDAIVMPAGDRDLTLLALAENTQRRQPHYVDSALELKRIIEYTGIDADELSLLSGIERATIESRLRLLELRTATLDYLRVSYVPERCAAHLLRILNEEVQLNAAREMGNRTLDEHAAARVVEDALTARRQEKRRVTGIVRDYRPYVNAMSDLIEQMRHCGIEAVIENDDTDAMVSMHIRIPKRATSVV